MKIIPFYRPFILNIPFLLLFAFASFAQTRYLIPYRDGQLWGYADTNRKLVVPAKYTVANPFSAGYALVKKGSLYGVLNSKGKEIIPTLYDTLVGCCYNYVIATKNENSGLIRLSSGQIILPLKYKKVWQLYNDYWVATGQNSLSGLVNIKTGQWVLPIAYSIQSDQFGWYKATKPDTTIYFTVEKDKLISGIPLKPEKVENVVDDSPPPVEMLESSNGDTSIHVLPVYDDVVIPFGMGWLYVVSKNGKTGVYSLETYSEIIPLVYDKVEVVRNSDFKEFFIVTRDNKTGVVAKGNKPVVPLRYEAITPVDSSVYNNFYTVKLNGKWGVVKGNEQILSCEYDYLWNSSSDGTAYVLNRNNKQGFFIYRRHKGLPDVFLNPDYDRVAGRLVLQANNFDPGIPYQIWHSNQNLIIEVYKDNKKGFVDQAGREYFKN